MFNEFRTFILKGNVVDMAVGIIIGAAFGTVVKSLVDDIIMPPIGMLLGGIDFSNLFVALDGSHHVSLAEAQAAGTATINYGLFINNALTLVLVGFAVFMLVKAVNRLRRAEAAPKPAPGGAPGPSAEVQLLTEIRDALRER